MTEGRNGSCVLKDKCCFLPKQILAKMYSFVVRALSLLLLWYEGSIREILRVTPKVVVAVHYLLYSQFLLLHQPRRFVEMAAWSNVPPPISHRIVWGVTKTLNPTCHNIVKGKESLRGTGLSISKTIPSIGRIGRLERAGNNVAGNLDPA